MCACWDVGNSEHYADLSVKSVVEGWYRSVLTWHSICYPRVIKVCVTC